MKGIKAGRAKAESKERKKVKFYDKILFLELFWSRLIVTIYLNLINLSLFKMKYLIVIEETSTGYSAFSPDLDGCVATGSTKKETEVNIKEAIEFHLEGLRNEGFEIPSPHSYSRYFEIPA